MLKEEEGVPVIKFDDISSSCSIEDSDGRPYLVLGGVEGLGEGEKVLDYVWAERGGLELGCDRFANYFIFFVCKFYFILFYFILFYFILFYFILFYFILFYFILFVNIYLFIFLFCFLFFV